MTTQKTNDKAKKRAEYLRKQRAALIKVMEEDVRQLRKMIHGQKGKK